MPEYFAGGQSCVFYQQTHTLIVAALFVQSQTGNPYIPNEWVTQAPEHCGAVGMRGVQLLAAMGRNHMGVLIKIVHMRNIQHMLLSAYKFACMCL